MSVISMKQLLEAGVHFGHQTRRWNPKMADAVVEANQGVAGEEEYVEEAEEAAVEE